METYIDASKLMNQPCTTEFLTKIKRHAEIELKALYKKHNLNSVISPNNDTDKLYNWDYFISTEKLLINELRDMVDTYKGVFQFKEKKATVNVTYTKNFKNSVNNSFRYERKMFEHKFMLNRSSGKFFLTHNDYLHFAMLILCEYLQNKGYSADKVLLLQAMSSEIFKENHLLQKNDTSPEKIISDFISNAFVQKRIIRNRTERKYDTLGWLDSEKDLIYLPYKTYFDDISAYWKATSKEEFLYNAKEFQNALTEKEILIFKKNGKSTSYRADFQVVVSSLDAESSTETVIKINVDRLTLTEDANNYLQELSELKIPKRKSTK